MKNKTNKRHARSRIRRHRTCKKGGMFRIMGKIVGEKGPNRAEKALQFAKKIKEGLTPKSIKKINHDASSPASFTDLLSPFRRSVNDDAHRPHSYDQTAHDEAMHKTPIRAHMSSKSDMPPNLPLRSKHADDNTPDAWAWAPTSQHPNQVVTKLFDD